MCVCILWVACVQLPHTYIQVRVRMGTSVCVCVCACVCACMPHIRLPVLKNGVPYLGLLLGLRTKFVSRL